MLAWCAGGGVLLEAGAGETISSVAIFLCVLSDNLHMSASIYRKKGLAFCIAKKAWPFVHR